MNIDSNFDLRKFRDLLLKETYEPALDENDSLEEASLEEMAKIAGDLKSSIEAVIAANPELQGLALKKAIKGDQSVINALDGDDLYDNQLNKFIALTKGERELGQRGRKANPDKPAAEPKTKAEKSPKLKITNPTADEKPVSSTFIDSEDEEEMAAEKAALKAAKGSKRLGTAAEKLAQVTKEMKALIPAYQAAKGTPEEAAIVAQLKALTAEKKSLESKVFKTPKTQTAADLMGGEELEEGFFGKLITGISMASIVPKALKGDKGAQDKLLQFFSEMSPEKQQSFIQHFKDEYINKDNVPFSQQLVAMKMIAKIQDLMGGEEI